MIKKDRQKKKKVLPVPHQTVTFPPVHTEKQKEDSLHIQHFII